MTFDSDFGKLPGSSERKRVRFDPTINLGHIISFAGFIVAGFLAYGNLDKRQTVQEVSNQAIEKRVVEQDQRLERALSELRVDAKETQRTLQRVESGLFVLQTTQGQKAGKP